MTTNDSVISDNIGCDLNEPKWYYFLAGSGVILLGGLVVLLIIRTVQDICERRVCKQKERVSRPRGLGSIYLWMKRQCELFTSSNNIIGKILSGLYVGLCIASFILYIYDADHRVHLEVCVDAHDPDIIANTVFNSFFVLHFIIRFIASRDKVREWIGIQSLIDHFTLVPWMMSLYMGREWLGLRFLRAFGLVGLSNLLQAWRVLKDKESIRLAQLMSFFVSVWLAGAGFIHLLEALGNFWTPSNPNIQNETYWTWVYFLLVTMSTVGYGDYSAGTVLGRIFVVIFIISAIGMFASFVPDIAASMAIKKNTLHMISYNRQYGERHVVVAGHITPTILKTFLKDFLNKDRLVDNNLKIIVLKRENPDLEMEALLRKYELNVVYIHGSVFNVEDLQRARLREASACVIMTNKQTHDPMEEDAEAIMRVIAVKDFDPDIRIIVQLIQYQHKSHLLTIPNWRPKAGDKVVCLSELMLGFMAQNCLAPGFSTLLANLFTLTSYDDSSGSSNKPFEETRRWQDLYKRSAAFEMYTSRFSDSFHGLTFREAARICYKKFDLLLIAISGPPENQGVEDIIVNPVDDRVIDAMTEGFFIAQSEAEAIVVSYYCLICHDGRNWRHVHPGSCACYQTDSSTQECCPLVSLNDELVRRKQPYLTYQHSTNGEAKLNRTLSRPVDGDHNRNHSDVISRNVTDDKDGDEKFDCTGLFHWISDRPMEAALITHQKARQMDFTDHVVLCLFAEDNSPLIGLCSFIMPLRSSNIAYRDLKPVVIVGNTQYVQREWTNIMNFPKVWIVSSVTTIDSSPTQTLTGANEHVIQVGNVQLAPLCRAYLRSVNIFKCCMCVVLNASKSSDDMTLVDKEAILCTLNIKTMPMDLSDTRQEVFPGEKVMTITELVNDDNVQYLEQDDESDNCEIFMSQPYACGRVFTGTLLDSLMSTTYHNPNALALIRAMVTGGVTSHIEQIYAEGMGLLSGEDVASDTYLFSRNKTASVTQYPVDSTLFAPFNSGGKYGELVLYALNTYGILVLGLYHLLHPYDNGAFKRCVITHPPPDFHVIKSDLVFCIRPYSMKEVAKDESTSFSDDVESLTTNLTGDESIRTSMI